MSVNGITSGQQTPANRSYMSAAWAKNDFYIFKMEKQKHKEHTTETNVDRKA